MENRLQLALEESSKNLQLPIKAEHAKYGNIEGKNPKNKCIVCLTSGGIHIREESKSVKLKANYIWYDLIKMAINVPLLQLTFRQREKTVKKENSDADTETLIIEIIESKAKNQKENANSNFQTFIQYLSDILQRVLTPFELKRISFYTSILTEKVKPTFVSIMSRLSMILPLQKYQMQQASIETLKSMFFSRQTLFNLSTFKDPDVVIPIVFELFPLIDYLEVVKIPEISNFPVYKASSYFLFQLNSVKYIEISGPKDDGFSTFLQKLQKSNVKTISYSLSNFGAQDLELIKASILCSNIHCIEFHEAINEKEKSNFYNNFLTTEMCSHIWSLNFNNTSNLNLPILLQKLNDISSLSLAFCNIEINTVVRLIHESKMKYLKYLNLSGNPCNETLDMSLKLPRNLTHIMVNDVSWNDKSLTSFISLVLQLPKNEKNQKIHHNQINRNKKPKDLYLSISHAITLQYEWARLFQLLHFNYSSSSSMNVSFLQFRNSSHSSYNFSELRNAIANEDDDDERFYPVTLRSLAWDENPVDTSFFDFLSQCKELETLSLNSCFHETLESSLNLFVDYIKSNDSLKRLFVAGSKKDHLGKKVIKVIDACLDKKNLKILDLSISKCDSDCLKEFLPLFDEKRSSLDVVIIDGIFPSDAETFLGFLNQIRIMNSKTKISFPTGDCLNLKKQKKIGQKQMNEINSVYKVYDSSNNDEKIDVDLEPFVKFVESEEEKSSSSTQSSNKNSNKNANSKNVVSVKRLKHSDFLKQPYFYKYFYEPFIPYYLEMDEVNEIRLNKVEDEDENQEFYDKTEIETGSKLKTISIEIDDRDDDENDNFTLLQMESEGKEEEEEEEEAGEKEVNKTFTLQLDEFEPNMIEEEEEEDNKDSNNMNEEDDDDEAIPRDFNNSVNIIQTMQKSLDNEKDKNDSQKVARQKNNFFGIENYDENQENEINMQGQKSINQAKNKDDPEINIEIPDSDQIVIEYEYEEEDEDEKDRILLNPRIKKNTNLRDSQKGKKQIIKKVVNDESEEEQVVETEIKNRKKTKQKAKPVNKNRRKVKTMKKKSQNKINDEEEEETENRSKNKRSTRSKRKQPISKNKKSNKQVRRRVSNDETNQNEEEEIQSESKSRKRIKQKRQPQQIQNKKQTKTQIKKKIINKVIENEEEEIDNRNRKNGKTKMPLENKKQVKQIKKRNLSFSDDDENSENQDQNFQQYLNSNVSTSFDDETVEKTEVDDTIMNVTVGANDLHDYDNFETYESYEIVNHFTTPRQAKGSNLNRNVSKNKNRNMQNIENQDKNIQIKSIKKISYNNVNENGDANDKFQLSPLKQNLINNFSTQYNLNDFEIIFSNFEPVHDNSEIWTNMNEEFSINKLFNNVKLIKEARS